MNTKQLELWEKLCDYELDDPEVKFSFTDRLTRENGWEYDYTLRAIEEYKKFIFLIACSGHPCTPSDEVDQVWHLHLLYTQSYWKEMCESILGIEIHHGPTKGKSQRSESQDYYSKTKTSYQLFFKEEPPKDIWPDAKIRFKYTDFRRVNMHLNKISKKWKF
ncbi:MAG: hypothetical protein JKX68_12505 [Flavobacteriales bacterium]|nr:hypothetical protein [Flavobacteriales bacterium]